MGHRIVSLPSIRSLIRVAGCLVGIVMLLAFPVPLSHQFSPHYRSPQVRRAIERHTFVAQPEGTAAGRISRAKIRPVIAAPALEVQVLRPQAVEVYFVSWESQPRLLIRRKAGPSRTGDTDPFSLNLA